MSYAAPSPHSIAFDALDEYIAPNSHAIGLYLSAGSYDMYESVTPVETPTTETTVLSSDSAIATVLQIIGAGVAQSESASGSDTFVSSTITMYLEAIGLTDSLTTTAHTTQSLIDSANVTDVVIQAINQIMSESASGADTFSLGAALTLVDVALAADVQLPTYNCVMLVAELIAAIDAANSSAEGIISDSAAAADAFTNRVQAIFSQIEAAIAADTMTGVLNVFQIVTDSPVAVDSITSTGSVLHALLTDSVTAFVRLNIGGELFTGWVLNTGTMAASEYQFADLAFNSACKHGDAYLMAADDGIYQFTEEADVETVMTYIKTGKMDFGSDQRKRIVNSYMVYSAKGKMVLKVTVSENSQLQTYTYQMMPFVNDDTPDARRFDLGKGMKSRYWQFEIVGEGADPIFDEIGMLPVVLSRRI